MSTQTVVPVGLTLAEAAELVRCSEKTLRRAIHATEPPFLQAKKFGSGYRIKREWLEAWFESLPDA